ncbi:MAG: toll/interleukin-1 receptor domain-containing protein [Nitrospirae bacterium]|nr:toll/interleukin-1 receptor domain-containing protein [Nitrospirota bacterium]
MKVFISHTSKDHDFVLQLAGKMKKDNIDVWIDDWELEIGDSIVQKISEGLEKSSFLIVVISEYSIKSEWVLRELNSTLMRQMGKDYVVILPVLLELEFNEAPPLLHDIYSVKFERNFIVDSQYQKLIEPIRKKTKTEEISKYQDKYFENIEHVDLILKKQGPSRHEVNFILELIQNEPYKNYFFKQVTALHWFNVLKAGEYFDAINALGPKPAEQEGFYSIPWWNVLSYLEKVSEQVKERGNEKYIDELLQIIKEVSNHKNSDGQHVDNYHTWRSFVLILLNIPREKIPINIIELIPVWLSSRFDASLVGSELGLKLLPNFLSGNPFSEDITKAERIVDYITNVKSVKLSEERARIYNREEEYKLVIDSYWVKDIFEKHIKDIGEKCTNSVVYALCEKIRTLLKKDDSLIPFEAGDKAYLLALTSVDGKYLVKVFDMGEKSGSDVYEYVFMKKKLEGTPLQKITMDETTLDNFSSNLFDDLTKDVLFKSIETKELKRDIYRLYFNFHDEETHASFYDGSRTHLTDPLEVLSFVLKSILMIRSRNHADETKKILEDFFMDKYFYFPKMALYIIGNNANIYNDIFWNVLGKDTSNLIFGEIYFGDELKHILENLTELSPHQKELIIKKLKDGPGFVPEEDAERHIAEWKQERCQALVKFPEFKELYESLKSQTGRDVGLHAAVGEIHVREGGGPSPLSKEEILKMLSAKTLPSYLKDFKSTGFWEEGPTVGGLARLIKECVAEKPNKFIDDLYPFINSGFTYIYEILDGAREAWSKKLDIAWDKLFEFMHLYINRDEFGRDEFIVEKGDFLGGANHFWIIGAIMQLVQDGTRDDSWAYDEKYFPKAEEIIFLILSKLEAEEEKEITDYVTHALNSPHGKTIIALINHALRIARVKDKKGDTSEVKWSDEIKGKYNELLKIKIIESYTMLGRYLPNLFYLDKTWAEEKVKSLYPVTDDKYWEAFIDGYLSIGQVYDELYNLMIPHYKYGITHEFKNKHDNEHLAQHIALEYLLGKEDVNNPESLFRKVLNAWNREQILDVVSFLWSQQKYIEDEKEESRKIVDKIISCWKWIYDNRYKTKPETDIGADDKKILSALGKLTIFLPHINAEYSRWLLLAAPYINENYHSSFIIEYLDKFDDPKSIGYVGKIFLKMLEHFIADFRQEHIRSIVEKLYINQNKEDADNICNIYGMKGYEFLRGLYEKYNKM